MGLYYCISTVRIYVLMLLYIYILLWSQIVFFSRGRISSYMAVLAQYVGTTI
jgi:hypothetical protein